MEAVVFGGVYMRDTVGEMFNWDVLVAQWFSVGGLLPSTLVAHEDVSSNPVVRGVRGRWAGQH